MRPREPIGPNPPPLRRAPTLAYGGRMTIIRAVFVLLALVVAACAPAATTDACVDINADQRERLMDIIHIDEVRSAELITLRPFASIDGLTRITGIGDERLGDIREQGIVCPID